MASDSESKTNPQYAVWAKKLPAFVVIPCPEKVLIPLFTKASIPAEAKPAGTELKAGESLVENGDSPKAMRAGRLGNTVSANLANKRIVTAVEFFPVAEDPASNSTPAPASTQSTELTPEAESPAGGESNSEKFLPIQPPVGRTKESLSDWIRYFDAMGIWIDRRDSPDLLAQFEQALSCKIDTIVCTVLDSDASARVNAVTAAQYREELADAIRLVVSITGASRAMVAIEDLGKPKWAAPVRSVTKKRGFELFELDNDYPQADPTLMLYTLLHRKLKPDALPTSQKTIVLDAAAALELSRAITGEPRHRSRLVIRDHVRAISHFVEVTVGSSLFDVMSHLKIRPDHYTIRGGDLLRDLRITGDTILGGSESVIHLTPLELRINPEPCIRSAWCIEACPTLVNPAGILEAAQRHDPKMARTAGIEACIECGLCSHVCPSRLPILESIRYMKGLMESPEPVQIRKR